MAKPNGEALKTYEVHAGGRDVEVKAHDFITTRDNIILFRRRRGDEGMEYVAAFALGDGGHVKEKE